MDSFYKSNKDYQRVATQIEESAGITRKNKDAARSFTQRLVAEGISPARIKKYLTITRNISEIVKRSYKDYTASDVQKILAYIHTKGFAVWTVNDYKTTIKRLLRFMQGDELDPRLRQLLKVNKKGPNKFAITYNDLLTKEEVEKLVRSAHSPMFKCLVSLAYETGARPSELLTLTIGSVAFAEGYTRLFLRESKTFVRTVYAMDSDRYLRAWLNLHPLRDDRSAPLFPSSYISYARKDFLQPESYNTTLKRLARKLGINKRIYSYLLRHSRITHLLEAGWNEVMIKKLVGHSVDSAAFKVYEHLAEKQVEEYILRQRGREKAELGALGVSREKVCTFCKTENELDADFCVHCNRTISVKGLMESAEKEKELLRMLTPEMIDALVEKKVEGILQSRRVRPWPQAA